MKKNISLLALLMILVFGLSLLTGCGGSKNKFLAEDCIDGGITQQRWLKNPESHIILNPSAVGEESYTNDARNGAISIGLLDDNGEVKVTLDDVYFVLESKTANGKGENVIYKPCFTDGQTDTVKGLGKITVNNSADNHFSGSTGTKDAELRFMSDFTIDLNDTEADDLYLKIDMNSIQSEKDSYFFVVYYVLNPFASIYESPIEKPGTYLYSLKEAVKRDTEYPDTTVRATQPIIKMYAATEADFTAAIVTFGKGCAEAAVDATHTWAPWQITSELSYQNGTALHMEDILMGDCVSRSITCKSAGDITMGGKIYGTPAYDAKANKFTFTGDGFIYVVNPKRKGDLYYYNSMEDLLNGINGSTEYSGQTYWGMASAAPLTEDDSFNVGVAGSLTKTADELNTLVNDACSVTKINRYKETLVEFWDNYIAENDVSGYISKIPE